MLIWRVALVSVLLRGVLPLNSTFKYIVTKAGAIYFVLINLGNLMEHGPKIRHIRPRYCGSPLPSAKGAVIFFTAVSERAAISSVIIDTNIHDHAAILRSCPGIKDPHP